MFQHISQVFLSDVTDEALRHFQPRQKFRRAGTELATSYSYTNVKPHEAIFLM